MIGAIAQKTVSITWALIQISIWISIVLLVAILISIAWERWHSRRDEIVRCPDCIFLFGEIGSNPECGKHGHTLMEINEHSFCSAGMTGEQWMALYGDELEGED